MPRQEIINIGILFGFETFRQAGQHVTLQTCHSHFVHLQSQGCYSLTLENGLLLQTLFLPVLLCILDEAPDHQDHDNANREGAYNADALDVVHAALREHKGDGQYDQQQAPKQDDCRVRLLVLIQLLVAVASCGIGNGVKAGSVERNHADQNPNKEYTASRHGLNDIHNQLIKVSVRFILCDKISSPGSLKAKAVIAKDNEGTDCRANAEYIAAQDGLLYSTTTGYIADEERCRNAPNHPVGPVVDRPILREVVRAHRIHVCRKAYELLEQLTKALHTVLDDESALSADEKEGNLKAKEQIDAELCQEADPLESVEHSIGVNRAGDEQYDDRDCGSTDRDAKQSDNDLSHQRGGYGEGCRSTGKQRKQGEEVNDTSKQAMRMLLSDDRKASLAVSLFVPLPAMKHEAERNSKNKIERPGNEAPMEQRENTRPLRDVTAHLSNVRVGRIHDPFCKAIEQNVGGKTAGEHHRAPCEEVVLRLFILLAKDDVSVFGHGEKNRYDQHTKADDQVVAAKRIAKEETDLTDDAIRLVGEDEKIHGQCHDQNERHQRYQPVYPALVCCLITHWIYPPLSPAFAGMLDSCGRWQQVHPTRQFQ